MGRGTARSKPRRDGRGSTRPPSPAVARRRGGALRCIGIAFGRVFTAGAADGFASVVTREGGPNGLEIPRNRRILIADCRNGIGGPGRATGRPSPAPQRLRPERPKVVNGLVLAPNGDPYPADRGLTGPHDPTGRVFRARPLSPGRGSIAAPARPPHITRPVPRARGLRTWVDRR